MALNIGIKVDGMKELHAALQDLGTKHANAGMKSGLNAAAKIAEKAAGHLAPRGTALLRLTSKGQPRPPLQESITRKVKVGKRGGYAVIGPASHQAPHKHLVEEGVAAHKIKVVAKKGLYGEARGGEFKFFGREVRSPGFQGLHFMRRAFQQSQTAMGKIMEQKLLDALVKRKIK